MIPVRALLSDCNTARKVAAHPRELLQAVEVPTASAQSDGTSIECDSAASEVLSIRYFTTLQLLLLSLLYSPLLIGFLGLVAFSEIGEFFMTAYLWEFIIVGFFLYALALVLPFASLCWVMMIKYCMGGDIYKNNVTPGCIPSGVECICESGVSDGWKLPCSVL